MKYTLTFRQWERVLDRLVDAGAAFFECYDTIEDVLWQYDDFDHDQEFTIVFKDCSDEALQELKDIIGGITMKTVSLVLTVYEWRKVLHELSDAGVSFYELYGDVENLVFGYKGDMNTYERLDLTGSDDAFDELRQIFNDLGFVIDF